MFLNLLKFPFLNHKTDRQLSVSLKIYYAHICEQNQQTDKRVIRSDLFSPLYVYLVDKIVCCLINYIQWFSENDCYLYQKL